jgi:hypothetical protein
VRFGCASEGEDSLSRGEFWGIDWMAGLVVLLVEGTCCGLYLWVGWWLRGCLLFNANRFDMQTCLCLWRFGRKTLDAYYLRLSSPSVETCVRYKPQGFALACLFHYYWLTIHLHRRSLVAVLHSVCRLWRRTLPSTIPLHAYVQMCVCTFALETWLLLAHTTPHPHLHASWWL